MAKGSARLVVSEEGEMSMVVKHLQKLETENAELRKQLEDVVAYIGKPNIRHTRKKRRQRQLSPSSRNRDNHLEQPSNCISLREASLQSSRPSTSVGIRGDAGPVTVFDLHHEHIDSHIQPMEVRRVRPTTSSGTRSQHDNLRPIQGSSAYTPHSQRVTVQQRSLSRSAPIVVPNREAAPVAAWQQRQAPAQQHLRPRQAVQAPIRPSTSIGSSEERHEPLSSPSSSQSWQGYRKARRRPNTSLGTRIRGGSAERAEKKQDESEQGQSAQQQKQPPSPQRLRPATAGTLKTQRSEPLPAPSRWKSKAFNQEDFDRFLRRQSEHANSITRRSLDMEQLTGLSRMQTAPLLPISSMMLRIDGGLYVENDGKVKAKKLRQLSSSLSLSSDLSMLKSQDSRPGSPTKDPATTRPRNTEVLDTAQWRAFLSRQADLLRRQGARCNRCKSPDPFADRNARKSKGSSPSGEIDVFEKFFQRNLEYRQAKEDYLQGLHNFYCASPASPRIQDPHFMVRHDPKNVHAVFEEAVEEAKAKWKIDQPLEPGESPLFKKKVVKPSEVEEFWEKNKDFPHVSNRESHMMKDPPEPGFNFTGNPYHGGKAEKLAQALGPKAGIDINDA